MQTRAARAQQTHLGTPTQQVSTNTAPQGLYSSGEAHILSHNDGMAAISTYTISPRWYGSNKHMQIPFPKDGMAAISTDTVPQRRYGSGRHKYRPPTTVRQQRTRSDSTSKIDGDAVIPERAMQAPICHAKARSERVRSEQ